ncbi:unnamed protein product [Paramecium primaurelia]|uniref:Uncharacterized protein n=1 Tax=Paramecium primaurelia TaxID=5886 RepID=A0A8S1QCZ7_PARPR|nr:unnamed protein product [Paramecium primaurelia]
MCQQNYNRIKFPQKKQSLKILQWISRKKNNELRRIKIKVITKHYQGDMY